MPRGLFAYPRAAAFNRVIPKSKIYAHAKPSRRVRDRFTREVAQIIWQYKLAPGTINLPAAPGSGVPEIQIFNIRLKPEAAPSSANLERTDAECYEDILRAIDKAIGFPVIFELTAPSSGSDDGDRVQAIAAHKRPSEADSSKWVIGDYYATGWLPPGAPGEGADDTARSPLPVALNLTSLYEQMLRTLMPTPARPGESLQAQAERQGRVRQLQKQCRKLEAQLNREKQFNRKVELNRQLRQIKAELDSLSAPTTGHA